MAYHGKGYHLPSPTPGRAEALGEEWLMEHRRMAEGEGTGHAHTHTGLSCLTADPPLHPCQLCAPWSHPMLSLFSSLSVPFHLPS